MRHYNCRRTDDRAFQYDGIGNRLKSADSLTLPTTNNYTPNALNQYSSITNPQSTILNPSYDDDGNMTSGPLPVNPTTNSTLTWDAENRLIEVKNAAGVTIQKNIFDSGSRKIATTNYGVTTVYIYDVWNCIAEYTGTTLSKTRLWSIDLSNSSQGAGGVGGILSENQGSEIFYSTYDGNGNVSEYLDSTGSIVAHYEYDPFGKTTVATGLKANDFAYRFSTKPRDEATGLHYYGYRWYDPATGRWPSRDWIGERGGVNLYQFVENDGIHKIDILGTSVHAIMIAALGDFGVKGEFRWNETRMGKAAYFVKTAMDDRKRILKLEIDEVKRMTDDDWNKMAAHVVVYFKGKKSAHQITKDKFIEWMEYELKSELKIQTKGREKELKVLADSFVSIPSAEYEFHQNAVAQHSYRGYPEGSGKRADVVLPDWDYSTCGEPFFVAVTSWELKGGFFVSSEKTCTIYYYPMYVKEIYFDDKGNRLDDNGNRIE